MIVLRIALLLCLGLPGPALAAHSAWTESDQSQLRLLLSAPRDGRIPGGIEIVMDPGWHTYWRNPGEAGVPPVFDFSGSENVANVEVLYPAPERLDDGGAVSLIYPDEVVFPLAVTASDPARAVTVRLQASFGVCREVCIPARASSAVTLAPEPEPDPLADATLARYLARVPRAPEPGRFDVENVTVEGNALLVDVRMPDSTYLDLFAEPPAHWYIGQPALLTRDGGVSRYRLALDGKPPDAPIAGQRFRFLARAGGEAIEKTIDIR